MYKVIEDRGQQLQCFVKVSFTTVLHPNLIHILTKHCSYSGRLQSCRGSRSHVHTFYSRSPIVGHKLASKQEEPTTRSNVCFWGCATGQPSFMLRWESSKRPSAYETPSVARANLRGRHMNFYDNQVSKWFAPIQGTEIVRYVALRRIESTLRIDHSGILSAPAHPFTVD